MTQTEFAALVAVHQLPVAWLARHVLKNKFGQPLDERTARYWCNGRTGVNQRIPDDAAVRMLRLNQAIKKALAD